MAQVAENLLINKMIPREKAPEDRQGPRTADNDFQHGVEEPREADESEICWASNGQLRVIAR